MKLLLRLQRHPDSNLQFVWDCTQIGVLIFPFNAFLGAVCFGLVLLLTWRRNYRRIIRRPLNWGLAVLSLLLIFNSFFAYDRTIAFLGLFNLLPFFLFFATFSTLIQTTAQLRRLAWLLVAPSVPVVIIGLGQLFLGWKAQVQILWVLVDFAIARGGNPPQRMSAIFSYANVFAAYLVITFTFSLGLWIENYQKLTRNPQHSTRFSPLFLTVAVISNLAALILTDSRNAWGITVIVCLAYALYLGWRWLVGIVTGIVASVIMAAFAPAPINQWLRRVVPSFFWARLTDDLHPDRPVALMRKTQWQFAWSLTQQRPWTGWGLRNFTEIYKDHMHLWLGHPHNLFLMLSAETGLPATILFCSLVGWIAIKAVEVLKKLTQDQLLFFSYLITFLACTLFNSVDVTVFDFRVNTLSWLVLAAISGVVYHHMSEV